MEQIHRLKAIAFQSTLPARGATRRSRDGASVLTISIHAPRTGSDVILPDSRPLPKQFQSTLPARGATRVASLAFSYFDYFNPRSPHGERPYCRTTSSPGKHFNPRSPHGERLEVGDVYTNDEFQSTLPARGATCTGIAQKQAGKAFQSTLPARGATGKANGWGKEFLFQSTLPARGATLRKKQQVDEGKIFQSTLPARGATAVFNRFRWYIRISIHAPRTGSDDITGERLVSEEFQSTLPARGATGRVGADGRQPDISIHAPRTGSDRFWRLAR